MGKVFGIKGAVAMKKALTFLCLIVMCLGLCACGSSRKGNVNSYDYDKGYGYSAPKSGQSFSDYVKEQDPGLYDNIVGRYNSLK